MKILFICNQNKHRSKTAEELFQNRFETKSCGLYNENPVSQKELDWADLILVMEEEQRHELSRRFPQTYLQKQIINLNIPDCYSYRQKELILALEERMENLASPSSKNLKQKHTQHKNLRDPPPASLTDD